MSIGWRSQRGILIHVFYIFCYVFLFIYFFFNDINKTLFQVFENSLKFELIKLLAEKK